MFQSLEPRRLMTTVVDPVGVNDAGTLYVIGSHASERIAIVNAVQSSNAVTGGEDGFVSLLVVVIDGKVVERVKANRVKAINVFANGGNDRVSGPTGDEILKYGNIFTGSYNAPVKNMLVHGGSGNDRITGGDGDDVLLGERGDDTLTDYIGRDRLDGGRGNDALDARDYAGYTRGRTVDYVTTPDALISGPGNDTLTSDADDVLTDKSASDVIGPISVIFAANAAPQTSAWDEAFGGVVS